MEESEDERHHQNLNATVAAVLEVLDNTQNFRIALLIPHIARKVISESVDDSTNGILGTVDDSILIDLPLRNLLYESHNVQTHFYELELKHEEPYEKTKIRSNSLLLLDPIRLSQNHSTYMSSLVSLGVGTKLRELYGATVGHLVSDYFLRDVEVLQLQLVELVFKVTRAHPKGLTVEDIEVTIVNGCQDILKTAQHIKNSWKIDSNNIPLFNELVPYLDKCLVQIQNIIRPIPSDGSQAFIQENYNSDYVGLKILNDKLVDTHSLEEFCKAVVAVAHKSSTLLSLVKLKFLEERQLNLEVPGSLRALNTDYLLKGIMEASLDYMEAYPLLILCHFVGSYTIREWVLRFIVERMYDITRVYFKKLEADAEYGPSESAYFRTAGNSEPTVHDYLSILPTDLLNYLKLLIEEKTTEGDGTSERSGE